MRLTKLVPALALVAAVAAPSAAIELADGALTISGDVEFSADFTQDDDGKETESNTTFAHDVDLSFTYRVGDDVEASFEIEEAGESGVKMSSAYLTWGFADNVSLTVGKFGNWLGDTDQTINGDFSDSASGNDVHGFQVDYSMDIDEASSLHLFAAVTEDIFDSDKSNGDLAAAVGAIYANDAFGEVAANINLETQDNSSAGDKDSQLMVVNVYGTIDVVEDWTFGAAFYYMDGSEIGYQFLDETAETTIVASAYATYSAIPTSFPSEATLQISYVDYDRIGADGVADLMIQGAYFFKPTSNNNFTIGTEIQYVDREERSAGGDSEGDLTFSLKFSAAIP